MKVYILILIQIWVRRLIFLVVFRFERIFVNRHRSSSEYLFHFAAENSCTPYPQPIRWPFLNASRSPRINEDIRHDFRVLVRSLSKYALGMSNVCLLLERLRSQELISFSSILQACFVNQYYLIMIDRQLGRGLCRELSHRRFLSPAHSTDSIDRRSHLWVKDDLRVQYGCRIVDFCNHFTADSCLQHLWPTGRSHLRFLNDLR